MILTKPCARGGCTGEARGRTPSELARARFCSARCSALERYRRGGGYASSALALGSRIGGVVSAERRHRRAAEQTIERAAKVLPVDVLLILSREQIARLYAALARLEREAYRRGVVTTLTRRRREQRRAHGKAA